MKTYDVMDSKGCPIKMGLDLPTARGCLKMAVLCGIDVWVMDSYGQDVTKEILKSDV